MDLLARSENLRDDMNIYAKCFLSLVLAAILISISINPSISNHHYTHGSQWGTTTTYIPYPATTNVHTSSMTLRHLSIKQRIRNAAQWLVGGVSSALPSRKAISAFARNAARAIIHAGLLAASVTFCS